MKFVFDYRGSSVQASVRGEYELKSLKQTGCNEFRSEPTGRWIETRNGKRKMETRGVEYVTTKAGRFEREKWHSYLEEAVFCEDLTRLLNVIIGHVRAHCAWLHTNKDTRNYALECLSSGAYHSWKL